MRTLSSLHRRAEIGNCAEIHDVVSNVKNVVVAAIALHNDLRQTNNACYGFHEFLDSESSTGEIIEGHWRRKVGDNYSSRIDGITTMTTL